MRILKSISIIVIINFNSCSLLESILNQNKIQKPEVQFTNVKIAGLSFDKVDLLFDIKIANPNSVDIDLAGFDYELLVNQKSVISGQQKDQVKIKTKGENTIQFPVSLKFLDIYKTITGLKNKNKSKYQIKCGLKFDLPILGDIRIPISKSGDIPHFKLPKININSINPDKFDLSGGYNSESKSTHFTKFYSNRQFNHSKELG